MEYKYIFLSVCLSFFIPAAIKAQTVIDSRFGNGGTIVKPFQGEIYAIRVLPDGKILAAGQAIYQSSRKFLLMRFFPDGRTDSSFVYAQGQLDPSYGVPGSVYMPNGGTYDMELLANGKVLLGSYQTLVRYNPNGDIDKTFGTTGNYVTYPTSPLDGRSLLLLPDSSILFGGPKNYTNGNNISILKYNQRGILTGQWAMPTYSLKSETDIVEMVRNPDGKIVGIGTARSPGLNDFAISLVRFNANGTIDNTFGINGRSLIDTATKSGWYGRIALLPNGQFLIAQGINGGVSIGSGTGSRIMVMKANADGSVDSSFGTQGRIITSISDSFDAPLNIRVLPNGKFIVAGYSGSSYFSSYPSSFAVLRYNADGTLDSTFGKRGILLKKISALGDQANTVCIDPNGQMIVAGHANYYPALVRYYTDHATNYNAIVGYSFVDNNGNGTFDSTERKFSGQVSLKDSSGKIISSSLSEDFSFGIDTGIYVSQFAINNPYFSASKVTDTSIFRSYFNIDTVAFPVQPIPGKTDCSITTIPLNRLRTGFTAHYRIFVRNNGTDTIANGNILFVKPDQVALNYSTVTPTNVSGDTLSWSMTNLKPGDTTSIVVGFAVPLPPAINQGDTVRSTAYVLSGATELTPMDNISSLVQRVFGSFDPNDKREHHGGYVKLVDIESGEYLTYTIRFQNTGNDTAFNIFVRDTLSDKLDWNTLQMVEASHNFELSTTDNMCTWMFRNINLVDSIQNEPGSHGYIVYKIRPKASVQIGDVITNSASIYFDYNLPVQTNTDTTQIVANILPIKLLAFEGSRTGKTNVLEWRVADDGNAVRYEVERSKLREPFVPIGSVPTGKSAYEFVDEQPGKSINYYRLKMVEKDEKISYSYIIIIKGESDKFSIYPNPATTSLQIKFDKNMNEKVEVQVVDVNGKTVDSRQLLVVNGLCKLSISKLAMGSYVVKVKVGNEVFNDQFIIRK